MDSSGYFARPNGLLLRSGSEQYRLELHRDTVTIPLGVHTVSVSESTLGGVPDWLIAEARTGTAIATYDSLHLHRADLTPVRWSARNGLSQLAVSFTPDSMFVALQDYQGRGSFAVMLPPGALITTGMIHRLLELLPLATGYRVNASLVAIDSGAPHTVPATITVEGEERVALPAPAPGVQLAGSQPSAQPTIPPDVDCWLVVLRAASQERRFWVSKSPQRVVKTEQMTASGLLTEVLEQ